MIYYPQPNIDIATQLLDHITAVIDQMSTKHPHAAFVILGDFNQLDISPLLYDSCYKQIVKKPTRAENILDKFTGQRK